MKKSLLVTLLALTMLLVVSTVTMAGFFDWIFGENDSKSNSNNLEGTELRVLAAYGGKDKIFAEFEKDTGIKVEFLDISSGEALARLKAEKGRPLADIWFGGGVGSFDAAKRDGLLEKYISSEAKNIKPYYKDKDGYWSGVSLVTVCFMVNEEICNDKDIPVPETWNDLLKPDYKGEISMANPAISGTTYAIVSGILQVMNDGWDYFQKLDNNIEYYAKRGGEPPRKAALGEVAIGLTPANGEFLELESQYPVRAVFPKDGIPWTIAPVAIFKGAKNIEGSKAFVDWALSKHGQEIIRDSDPRPSVRSDVVMPQILKDFKLEWLYRLDLEKAAKQRSTIIKKWQNKIDN